MEDFLERGRERKEKRRRRIIKKKNKTQMGLDPIWPATLRRKEKV